MKRTKAYIFILLMLPNIVLGSVLMKVISCTCSAVSAGIGGVLGGLAGAVSLNKYEDMIEKSNLEENFQPSVEKMKKRGKKFVALSFVLGAVLAGRAGYRTPHLLRQALRAAITRKKTIIP